MKFVLGLIFIILTSCFDHTGNSGVSSNIEESKRRKVFVMEYIVTPNPYIINDSLQITVNEAWIEKRWAYASNFNETIINEGFQLSVNSIEADLKRINFDWSIGNSFKESFRKSSKSSIMIDLESLPEQNKLEYLVQKGTIFNNPDTIVIIGKFELLKKE